MKLLSVVPDPNCGGFFSPNLETAMFSQAVRWMLVFFIQLFLWIALVTFNIMFN